MSATNYYDSTLFGYQGRVNPDYNKAELRELETEVLTVGLENQKYLMGVDEISRIKESTYRPVYGYQFVRKPSTNGTAMVAFNTGIQGASAQVPLTWIAFTEEFFTYTTTGFDNVLDHQMIWDNEMSQAQRNIRERLRISLTNNLFTNRTGYNPGGISNATWNATTTAWEISSPTQIWSDISSVMRQNKYGYSKYDVFASPQLYTNFQYSAAQGAMNATNLAYQFAKGAVAPGAGGRMDNIWEDIILGNEVPVQGAYTNGVAIVLPQNSFAYIPWMPKIYSDGSGNFEDYAGGYGIVSDDSIAGLEYMVHGWRTQIDASATHGFTQDSVIQWQIGVYVCFQTAVLSQATETPIYQFALTA
jgi:hypothetical protein